MSLGNLTLSLIKFFQSFDKFINSLLKFFYISYFFRQIFNQYFFSNNRF
uniref:Uncharacterized protein n=1 Tax=Clostridium botulinum TaxID=1491 RepID=A0A0A0UTW9_CLOBO|nr:hypothetical protein [Clostridium botulinum]AIW54936.1 hypothetical protein [Clostridium botulinum]AIW54991.1 hypothetical protein [Clostridium botulinum]